MDKYNLVNSNPNCLTSNELFEIECEFENKNMKSVSSKGSRFTHIENLQYSKDEGESGVNVPSTETEEVFIFYNKLHGCTNFYIVSKKDVRVYF